MSLSLSLSLALNLRCGAVVLAAMCGMTGVSMLKAEEKGKEKEKEEAGAKEVVLFDGKSLDDWKEHDIGGSGTVELKDGEMRIGKGESITGVIYQKVKDLPLTNYELTLEAKRLEGLDFFVGLTFPVGDLKTCATLVLGGWGGSVTGISSIDELDASENSTGHYRRFEDNRWYKVRLKVTPEDLNVYCDDELIISVDIKDKKVGVRAGPIEEFLPLSLTTYQTEAAIKNIKVKALEAKGE